MSTTFKGIVGTPVTPFTADNQVDLGTFEKLVNFLVESGIGALGYPMHIGESLNMTDVERKELVELAVKATAGRVPVIVNVSLSGTDQVVELARHAERVGASGVVCVTPYHWQPPKEALFAHFAAIGSAIGIPFLAYNFPERLGVTVTVDLIQRLIERFENFVGVKDASLDMEYFTECCRVTSELRPGFSMFTGIEYLLSSMVVGGVGAFSACGAVAPHLVMDLYDACASGEYERARGLQYKLSHLYNVIKPGYPATIKAAMDIMGRPTGPTRLPVLPFEDAGKARLRRELEALGILQEEPHGWTYQQKAKAA